MKRKPSDVKYSSGHTWVRMEGERDAIIGVTDYAIKGWGQINSIDLPKKGEKIKQAAPFAEIESEDNFLSIIAPLSGKILDVNREALKNPQLVGDEPYDEGWLVKIKLDDLTEIESLIDHTEYEELIEEEDKEIYEEPLEDIEDVE